MPNDNDQSGTDGLREAIHHAIMDTTDTDPEPLTSTAVLHIARLGAESPELISLHQVKKLCASVIAHSRAGTWVIQHDL